MSTPHGPATDRPPRGVLVALAGVALALLAGGWFLPLWVATLHAPQYPGGLTLRAYGHDVTGDVDEISALNHYVGMRPFDLADFPEIALWPFALAGAALAVSLALFVTRRLVRRLALVYLWGTPLGVLAVIQIRLWQYGQDLDPGAALRLDPFTPLVVGPTRVFNFTTWSWPGLGLGSIALAAAVVTFGPRLATRLSSTRVGGTAAAFIGGVTLLALAASGSPASAQARAGGSAPVHEAQVDGVDLAAKLARAEPGQRVPVPPGTHHGELVIDTPVVLEGRGRPTLLGDGTGTVVTIRAPGTVLRGVTIRGSGHGPTGDPAAIRIEADDVTVEDVVIEDSYIGIVVESAEGVRLVGNTIRGRQEAALGDDMHAVEHEAAEAATEPVADDAPDPATEPTTDDAPDPATEPTTDDRPVAATSGTRSRGDGIWLHAAEHVLIRDNAIEAVRDGIYVSFGSGTIVDRNVVRDSRYAVHSMFAESLTLVENHFDANLAGAVLMYRGPALLLRNHIANHASPSTGFAVLLKDVVEVEAVENLLVDNRVGLHIDGPAGASTPSLIAANTVARNAIGVSAYSSARASFRANSFVDNTVQVLPQGGRLTGVTWSHRGFGNLWSTYRGYEGAQGRGAVPHVEGGAVDRLLGRHPELLAIADTPALRLLRSVEERWGRQDAVLTDELPIVSPLSPALPVSAPEPAARTVGLVVGGLLVLPAVTLLVPRPRRRPTETRSLRAVTM